MAALRVSERLHQLTAGAESVAEQMQEVALAGFAAMNKRVAGLRRRPWGGHSNDYADHHHKR